MRQGRMYLKRAFSAPKICTVEAGHLARFVSDPAPSCQVKQNPRAVLKRHRLASCAEQHDSRATLHP